MQETENQRRQLGLGSATALVVGEVIGVGIFLTPADMARSIGSPFWLLVVWLVMGVVSLCGALSWAELSARFPQAGGSYVFLREVYGKRLAFLFGWMSLFLMDPGLTALLAVGIAPYVGYVVELGSLGTTLFAMGMILVLAGVNIAGVRIGAGVIRWLTVLKVGMLVAIVVLGFGRGLGDSSSFTPFVGQHPGSKPLLPALAGGLMAAFFSFAGWWDVSKVAGEIRAPQRNLPRALALGVVGVTVIYVLVSAVFLYLVPLEQMKSDEAFAAQVGEILFGGAGGMVFAGIVIVSVIGNLTVITMAAPWVYYAMANDGLFLPAVARLHPRFGTTARAIAVQATLACVLIATASFKQILGYFMFSLVVFLALIVAGLFVLRRRAPAASAYRTPGYPLTPLLFLALIAVFLVLYALDSPVQSFVGVGVVLLGWPVYEVVFRKHVAS